MIAEIFVPALRAYFEREGGDFYGGNNCPDEGSFFEMYEALGDRERQERIREDSPGVHHCSMLKVSANACIGCQKNPVREKSPEDVRRDREVIEENIPVLEHMIAICEYIRMGFVYDLKEISPDEAFALRMTWREITGRERAENAQMSALRGLTG